MDYVSETLKKSASIEDWIDDFVNSDNPMFSGDSTKKRTERAMAAYFKAHPNEEGPLMAPKNANTKPYVNIIKIVSTGGGREGSVSLMGNGNVQEDISIKEDLGIARAIAIVQLSLPKNTDQSLIESFVDSIYNPNKAFPTSIQEITDSFNKYNRTL